MRRCDQYRRIAESHVELFTRMNARQFGCPVSARYPESKDRQEYFRALKELEEHVAQCPVCRQSEVNSSAA